MVVDVRDPSTWRFMYSPSYCGGTSYGKTPLGQAQEIQKTGANGTYIATELNSWGWEGSIGGGYTWTQWRKDYVQALRSLGMLSEVHAVYNMGGLDSDTFGRNLLYNTGGLQDAYIANAVSVVQGMQPDIMQLLNEPNPSEAAGYECPSKNRYRDFLNREMQELASVKGDLTFGLMGYPFWDLHSVNEPYNEDGVDYPSIYDQLVVPAGCTLIETFHAYYWLSLDTPPQNVDNGFPYAYWTNQLALGKQRWIEFMGMEGVTQAMSLGRKLLYEESGTMVWNGLLGNPPETDGTPPNPNYQQYLRDSWGWCIQNGIGIIAFNDNGWSADRSDPDNVISLPTSWYPGGCFNEDWTLNGAGQVFTEFTQALPPTVVLPYINAFANLSNLSIINGDWSI